MLHLPLQAPINLILNLENLKSIYEGGEERGEQRQQRRLTGWDPLIQVARFLAFSAVLAEAVISASSFASRDVWLPRTGHECSVTGLCKMPETDYEFMSQGPGDSRYLAAAQ